MFVWQAYCTPTYLFFGNAIISSATGMQQGDPLSLVLFSLAIHSLVSELVSIFNVWYLDDNTLGGTPQTVLIDFTTIQQRVSAQAALIWISSLSRLLFGSYD